MKTLTWKKVEEQINNGEEYFKDIHIFTENIITANRIKGIFFENCIVYMDYVNKIDNCTFKNCEIKNICGCIIIKTLFDSCDIIHTNIEHGESYNSLFARCNFYNSEIHNYRFYNCEFDISNFFHSKIRNSGYNIIQSFNDKKFDYRNKKDVQIELYCIQNF